MISINDLLFDAVPVLRELSILLPILILLVHQITRLERKNNILLWRIEVLESRVKLLDARVSHLVNIGLIMNNRNIDESYETMVKRLKQEEKVNANFLPPLMPSLALSFLFPFALPLSRKVAL